MTLESTENRKVAKDRSPNFPFIPLDFALERARQFYEQEKRGAAPFQVAAKHWNYSPTSSGALQTAAAMISYGLMSDEGSGSGRKLRLTELALRILLDTRPDSPERDQYKREAALSPAVAKMIYQKWPDGLPSEPTLNHFLLLDLKFNEQTALKVSKIIYKNHDFTKIQDSTNISQPKKINEDIYTEQAMDALGMPKQPAVKSDQVTIKTERIIGPDGDIVLQFIGGEPSLGSYEFLEQYINLRKAILKAQLERENRNEKEEGE